MAGPADTAARSIHLPISIKVPVSLDALVHHEPGGGFSATIPALPGCFTEAETLEEIQKNLREAAEGWLMVKQDLMRVGRGPSA